MKKGNLYYLNGLTSTGKSSLLREMQARKSRIFYTLGFDLFEETLPEWCAADSRLYAQAIRAMYAAAKCLSDQGQEVFIDGLIMNIDGLEHHYEALKEIFAGYPLHIVSLTCAPEILRRRNLARGDRRENQSEEQYRITEHNLDSWLTLDTGSLSIAQCADLLLSKMAENE